jgi:hypothetical protein
LLYFSSAFGLAICQGSTSNLPLQVLNPSPIGRPLPIVCSHGKGFVKTV